MGDESWILVFFGQIIFLLRLGRLPLNLLIFEGSHGIERHFQQKQEYSCVESFDRELGEPHGPTLRQLVYVNDGYGNKMVGHGWSISNMLDNQTKHNLTKQKQILSFICYSEFFTSDFFCLYSRLSTELEIFFKTLCLPCSPARL